MLRSLKEIEGYQLRGADAVTGQVRDFLFDDQQWAVRYVVADTGSWLSGRHEVVIPASRLGLPGSLEERILQVRLSKEEIESSPSIDLAEPVSRRQERKLHEHFRMQVYWTEPAAPAGAVAQIPADEAAAAATGAADIEKLESENHLRSSASVRGYAIEAADGGMGHVEEFIAQIPDWRIRYLVVDTRNWLPGRKILVSPMWITDISWADRTVTVDLDRHTIEEGPRFDPSQPVNRRFEEQLFDYYGRPVYWS